MEPWVMDYRFTTYSYILSISSLIALLTIVLSLRYRQTRGSLALMLMMGSVAIWSFSLFLESGNTNPNIKIFWSQVEYIGVYTAAPLFLIFSLEFGDLVPVSWRKYCGWLFLIPAAVIVLAFTNSLHHLIWSGFEYQPATNVLVYLRGPFFWVAVVYVFICMLSGFVTLYLTYRKRSGPYRQQVGYILLAGIIPWLGSMVYLALPMLFGGLEITPVFFMISGALIAWNLYRYRLFDLLPVARDTIIETMRVGVVVLDRQDRILDINPSAYLMLGFQAAPIGEPATKVFAAWQELLDALGDTSGRDIDLVLHLDAPRTLELNFIPLTDSMGRITGRIITAYDISARRSAEQALLEKSRELERLSTTDDMTGLYNRRYVEEFLRSEYQLCSRYCPPFSIGLLDLDNFKFINDHYGHPAGDEVIRFVGSFIYHQTRTVDVVGRYGGDEFLVLFPHTRMADALVVMERLRTALESTAMPNIDEKITLSGGLTAWFQGDTTDAALSRVDALMYQAKALGGNHIVVDAVRDGCEDEESSELNPPETTR